MRFQHINDRIDQELAELKEKGCLPQDSILAEVEDMEARLNFERAEILWRYCLYAAARGTNDYNTLPTDYAARFRDDVRKSNVLDEVMILVATITRKDLPEGLESETCWANLRQVKPLPMNDRNNLVSYAIRLLPLVYRFGQQPGVPEKTRKDLLPATAEIAVLDLLKKAPSKAKKTPGKNPDKIALAIGFLVDHPEWSNIQIAEAVPCHVSTLSKSDKFRAARTAIRDSGKATMKRSRRQRGNDLDEYD